MARLAQAAGLVLLAAFCLAAASLAGGWGSSDRSRDGGCESPVCRANLFF